MQEYGFESDAVSNLVVGLTFFQLWYSTIPKEMQLGELSKCATPMQSEMSEGRFSLSMENSDGHDAIELQGTNFSLECDSISSVGNGKDYFDSNVIRNREVSMDVDDNMHKGSPRYSFQAQDFYMNPAERSGDEEPTCSFHGDDIPRTSIFYTHGEFFIFSLFYC